MKQWIYYMLILTAAGGLFAACDTEGDGYIENKHRVSVTAKAVFTLDSFHVDFAGKPLDTIFGKTAASKIRYYVAEDLGGTASDFSGRLQAWRIAAGHLDEAPQLDTLLRFGAQDNVLSLIQLPGDKLTIYDGAAGEEEPAPADESRSKLRFFYDDAFHTADSLRFVWIRSTFANLSLPVATYEAFDTLTVQKKAISRYVEFDSDYYAAEGKTTYLYYIRQTWNGSAWTGSTRTKLVFNPFNNGILVPTYKFATYQLGSLTDWELLLGEKWNE